MDPKHQILQAAVQLIAQKGFAATTIREIALMASVNLSMVHYYFKNKETLLENIVKETIGTVTDSLYRAQKANISEIEKIYSIIDVNVQFIFGNKDVAKIIFQEELVSSYGKVQDILNELNMVNRKHFEKIVELGQQKNLFARNVNPTLLYSSISGTIQQCIVRIISEQGNHENRKNDLLEAEAHELISYLKLFCKKILCLP